MLVQYARENDGTPTGVLVAEKVDTEGTVLIGWSGYHTKDENRPFTKEDAIQIALNRIDKGSSGKIVPRRMRPMLPDFKERARRYFHSDCVIVVGNTTECRD